MGNDLLLLSLIDILMKGQGKATGYRLKQYQRSNILFIPSSYTT